MKNKTALQWLIEQVHSDEYTHAFGRTYISIDLIDQAKEIEKEQIIEAFEQGENNSVDYFVPEHRIKESEQYYNETYGQ